MHRTDIKMMIADISIAVEKAHDRIREHILETPLIKSFALSEMVNGEVFLKLESEQHTGSFKARGSLNKLLTIEDRDNEVITASTGNHGLGFARAVGLTGIKGTVYLPHSAAKSKVKKIGRYPVKIARYENDPLATELYAKNYALENNAIWVSPYNDYHVLAGQGTIGKEILTQIGHVDDILVTMGGGGLISGIGAYIKTKSTDTSIIGCEPKHSPEMTLSLRAGKIVDDPNAKETLSDGSAGGIEPGAITFPICQQVVDHCVLVDESAIAAGIKMMVEEHGKIIEGSAAVTIASLLKEKERYIGRTVVLVICGGNIDVNTLKQLL